MAITFLTGFEGGHIATEPSAPTVIGTSSYSTTQKRTGAFALRCNPASGATGGQQYSSSFPAYMHFGLYVATLPSVERRVYGGTPTAGIINVRLTSSGTLKIYENATLLGTSSAAFSSPGWHWVGIRQVTGTSQVFLQIDGVDEVTATATITAITGSLGCHGTEASAIDIYIDDALGDDTGFLQPSNVDTALPISDNARGSGWVGGAGGTTNLFDAVNNTPPTGVVDTGTNASQIRNATSAANSDMDFNCETYTTLGIGASDTVLAVQPVIMTGAPVTTSAKQGTIGNASNPAIAQVSLSAGGTSGAFWSGTTAGTFPTGWKYSAGTLTISPTVTLGNSPVIRVRQVTSSTRIAMVCYMGLNVAWTPAAAAATFAPPFRHNKRCVIVR